MTAGEGAYRGYWGDTSKEQKSMSSVEFQFVFGKVFGSSEILVFQNGGAIRRAIQKHWFPVRVREAGS